MTLRIIRFFVLIDVIIGARLLNCPKSSIKFEKILGLRPPDNYHPLVLYKSDKNAPITSECISRCASNDDCTSFVLFYNTSTCYWFKDPIEGAQEHDSIIDMEVTWFTKVCLNVDNCDKLWIFDRVPGATVVGNDTKTLPESLTRTECQQHCLAERDFSCRSAKFRIKDQESGDQTRGLCVLSIVDRHILPGSYRASGFDEEYFENQCALFYNNQNQFCAYEEFDNATLAHSDVFYEKQTKESCQKLCDDNINFNCRGFSLVYVTHQNSLCFLHSEDTKVQGPKLLKSNLFGSYFEKAQCLNISIECSEAYMTVYFLPKAQFSGRLYMRGYPEELQCVAAGSGYNLVKLKLSVLAGHCGLIKALGPNNRTFVTGTMILQYNPSIQTQGDRVIRIGCIFGNDSTLVVGTGVTISPSAPNKGSTLLNTSTAHSPAVEMRIVDLSTQNEVSETQIGQELQLIVEIKPPEPFGIRAGHLVAMTEKTEDSILLLDERGCPTNLQIFPAFAEVVSDATRRLVATFQAFKFSSSPVVRFSVIVQFCAHECPPIICGNVPEPHTRKKRRISTKSIETINGTTVIKVNRSEFETKFTREMPLEIIMVVRGHDVTSDRLVVGNHKILVAGYDYTTDEVCIDYSLFIGVIITWVLIQIIFIVSCVILVRRYKKYYQYESARQSLEELHKNFGIGFSNLENRRVHWADNGELT